MPSLNSVPRFIDILWLHKGWQFVIPTFQQYLDKDLPENYSAKIRIAERNKDGSLDLKCLKGANVLIPMMEKCGREVIEAAGEDLMLIYQPATGIDNISTEACKSAGVIFCNAPGENYKDTAEGTVMLMLALARKLPEGMANVFKAKLGSPTGMSLHDKTLGIIGYGRIGREVERICKNAFFMNTKHVDQDASAEEFESLLRESDIISLHCPLTAETINMISAKELNLMKAGVLLVNSARGKVINRSDLEKALKSGRVGGFACDTYWEEPADPNDEFLKLPNVIVTPHFTSSTQDFLNRIASICVSNILALIEKDETKFSNRIV